MVNSTMAETGGTPCILADMGAFHLAEFAHTLCRPFVGSAVHGGIHILQIGSMKLHPRMLTFPTLNSTFKVWRLSKLNTVHVTNCIMATSYSCILQSASWHHHTVAFRKAHHGNIICLHFSSHDRYELLSVVTPAEKDVAGTATSSHALTDKSHYI